MYEITVTAQVANIRGGGGTSNVLLNDGTLLTFGRRPQYLETLPDEVQADVGKTLRAREIAPGEWKDLAARGAKPLRLARKTAAKGAEPTREDRVTDLTSIDGLGPKTAEKLLAHGLQREQLATATEQHLEAAGLGPAQITPIQEWQQKLTSSSPSAQLKAERIQES